MIFFTGFSDPFFILQSYLIYGLFLLLFSNKTEKNIRSRGAATDWVPQVGYRLREMCPDFEEVDEEEENDLVPASSKINQRAIFCHMPELVCMFTDNKKKKE